MTMGWEKDGVRWRRHDGALCGQAASGQWVAMHASEPIVSAFDADTAEAAMRQYDAGSLRVMDHKRPKDLEGALLLLHRVEMTLVEVRAELQALGEAS